MEMQKKVTPIREQLKSAEGEIKQELQIKAQEIDEEVKKYRKDFLTNNADKFFKNNTSNNTEIEIPEAPDSTGNPDKTYLYYKAFLGQH